MAKNLILYVAEKPAAYWMGTLYDRCLQADHVGYDPLWANFPSAFSFSQILEDLRDEDIKTVDFGYKDMQFKQCFGTLRRIESRVQIHAPTLRGIQLNLSDGQPNARSIARNSYFEVRIAQNGRKEPSGTRLSATDANITQLQDATQIYATIHEPAAQVANLEKNEKGIVANSRISAAQSIRPMAPDSGLLRRRGLCT